MWRANFFENEKTVVGSKTELRNAHVDILAKKVEKKMLEIKSIVIDLK